jgi:hypothetical protein
VVWFISHFSTLQFLLSFRDPAIRLVCLSYFSYRAFALLQVIVGSFMYGGSKKNKAKADVEHEEPQPTAGDEEALAVAMPELNMPPHPMSGWPEGMMRQMDSRSSNIDINSIRE